MADFDTLTQRSAAQLQDTDEAVVQPNGNVAPERTLLSSLKEFINADSGSVSGRENVLRAITNQQGSTNGVTSITLPNDYTDYDNLEVIAASDNENVTAFLRVPTEWLSSQNNAQSPKIGVIDHAEAGSRQWLAWNSTTRVLARGGQSASLIDIRIHSARLYDVGDPADETSAGGLDSAAVDAKIATHNTATDTHNDIRSLIATELADINSRFDDFTDFQSVTISSASSYQSTLNSQLGSDKALILVIDTAISGIRGGARYTYPAGQVAYIPPTSDVLETLFVLPQATGAGGLNTAQVDARVAAGVEDWAETGNTDELPPAKIPAGVRNGATMAFTALARTQRIRPINQWVRDGGAQTLLVEWKPVGEVANGAALTVSINGANIGGVTTSEGLAASDTNGTIVRISVNAANAGTIDRTSNAIAGHVEIQITHDGSTDSTWMGVTLPRDFREITGASPYTVRPSDTDFKFRLTTTQNAGQSFFTPEIPKVFITQATQNVPIATGNPTTRQGAGQWIGVGVSINAAGNQLTAAIAGSGGTAPWSIASVYAR